MACMQEAQGSAHTRRMQQGPDSSRVDWDGVQVQISQVWTGWMWGVLEGCWIRREGQCWERCRRSCSHIRQVWSSLRRHCVSWQQGRLLLQLLQLVLSVQQQRQQQQVAGAWALCRCAQSQMQWTLQQGGRMGLGTGPYQRHPTCALQGPGIRPVQQQQQGWVALRARAVQQQQGGRALQSTIGDLLAAGLGLRMLPVLAAAAAAQGWEMGGAGEQACSSRWRQEGQQCGGSLGPRWLVSSGCCRRGRLGGRWTGLTPHSCRRW